MTDRNEALRLADELVEEAERRVCHVAMAPASLLKDAAALLRQQAEQIDQLRAEEERLRADAERWTALRASNFQMVMHSKGKRVFWSVRPIFTNYEYSLFDSQEQAVDSLRNEQKEQS